MALKFKVEKLEDVAEALRGHYKQDPAGGFVLDAEGLDDGAELKRAKEHEKKARQEAEAKLKELSDKQKADEEKARKAAEDAARAAGNIEALEASWQKKYNDSLAAKDAEYQAQMQSLTGDVDRLLRSNVARDIAREIAVQGSDEVLIPHILNRLKVDVRDGQRVTTVVDAKGQTSALTIDDLKKEFVGNKAFSPLIAASKGSGGGAGGDTKGGGATTGKQVTREAFDAMQPHERMQFSKDGGQVV
jgi:hypothetical protein